MLYLAKYHRKPGYSDGAIYLGLIEAESKEEAEIIVAKMFVEVEKIYESDYEEDEEEFTTPKEIAAYQKRKQEWLTKQKISLEELRKERIEKEVNNVSISSINEMLHVQTISTTYRGY